MQPLIRLARVLWQTGDATIIDGVPNGLAELTVDGSRQAVKIQTGSLAVYAFVMLIGVVVLVGLFLLSGDRQMNAAGFPILSLITWLPLVGGLIIMSVRGDEATVASNARWTALWTSLIVLVLSLVLWVKFDTGEAGFQFIEEIAVAAGIRRRLQDGRRRHLGAVRAAVHRADADLHPGELGSRSRARCANSCSPS